MPAFNEGSRIGETLDGLRPFGYRIVVVDDGSEDDTAAVAAAAGATVLHHPINLGQGAAIQTGLDYAASQHAAVAITFDADGQHRPVDIAAVAGPIVAGEADVCLGSRFLQDADSVPKARRWLLRAGVVFTRIVSGIRVSDTHNGMRAFSRDALRTLQIRLPRMAHASELLDEIARQRLRYCEVPVHIRYRPDLLAKGQSGWAAFRITGEFLLGRLIR